MKERQCTWKRVFPVPADVLFAWHERDNALERLTPPWVILKSIRKTGGIQTGARVSMVNSVFGIPIPMEAEHIDYIKGKRFQDRLVRGPFSTWEHTHTFTPRGEMAAELEDRVVYSLPVHLPASLDRRLARELDRIFAYRHFITQEDMVRHRQFARPLTILMSGAGGVLGNALIPFLTTGGHNVIRLVRRTPVVDCERFWNPDTGILNLDDAGPIDVVINLNGSNISQGRWTSARRQSIVQSRNRPTELLARTIASLETKPELFISASATGYYGHGSDRIMTESSPCGDLFISDVCRGWENAAAIAAQAGIRTVTARIGVVLTPRGGALQRMLPAFLAGAGPRIASGSQYMSWISIDDLVYSLYHIMAHTDISGPVNLVAPEPVTNEEFTRALAGVLSRKARFAIPASLILALWGEMGREVLVASTRAVPEKLTASGFSFCHRTLDHALGNLLGKTCYSGRAD